MVCDTWSEKKEKVFSIQLWLPEKKHHKNCQIKVSKIDWQSIFFVKFRKKTIETEKRERETFYIWLYIEIVSFFSFCHWFLVHFGSNSVSNILIVIYVQLIIIIRIMLPHHKHSFFFQISHCLLSQNIYSNNKWMNEWKIGETSHC